MLNYLYRMKKFAVSLLVLCCALVLVSWYDTGHRTIGKIAENHLTPEASAKVKWLLGHETLASVAGWADDVKYEEYKGTAPWHFLNLPSGLSFDDFVKTVRAMGPGNIYTAIRGCEGTLQSSSATRAQKYVALKFLVHFVGDAHQPMHISRAEDRGGNEIAVKFLNNPTDLHSLWDGVLIEHQGLSYSEMAAKYDTATPEMIRKWQNDPEIIWLWESYQISSQLYTEMAENNDLGEEYYKTHMPLIQQRIEKAGIRLAGVLNTIFSNPAAEVKK